MLAVSLMASALLVVPGRAAMDSAELGNGFRVAKGTKLIGPVFGQSADVDDGWAALLAVNTDAVSAANAYKRQAATLGYEQTVSECSEDFDAPGGGFGCILGFRNDASRVIGTVRVCGACSPPVSMMKLSGGPTKDPEITQPIEQLPDAPTANLTPAQRRRADAGSNARRSSARFPLATGSQFMAGPVSFGYCDAQPGFDAVVRVSKQPDRVWRALIDQINSRPPGEEQRKTAGGTTIFHYSDPYWGQLTRLSKNGQPTYIMINMCGE